MIYIRQMTEKPFTAWAYTLYRSASDLYYNGQFSKYTEELSLSHISFSDFYEKLCEYFFTTLGDQLAEISIDEEFRYFRFEFPITSTSLVFDIKLDKFENEY